MEWMIETGYMMLQTFGQFGEFLSFEITIPSIAETAWNMVSTMPYPFPADDTTITIFEFMFGAGLMFFIGYTLIKWVLDIVL